MASSSSEIVDLYGRGHHKYDASNSISRSYQDSVLIPFCNQVLKLNCGSNIVADVATGNGTAARVMEREFGLKNPDLRVVQTDISELGLSQAQGERVRAKAHELPFPNESVRAIHFKDAVVHLPREERIALFKEFYRVLVPGGIVLLVSQGVFPGAFSYTEAGKDGEEIVKTQYILNRDHYLRSKRNKEKDPFVYDVAPPYYATVPFLLARHAKNAGLTLEFEMNWEPGENDREWHKKAVPRFVRIWKKK